MLAVTLSACVDIKGDVKIAASGEADLALTIDSTKAAAFASSMGQKANATALDCAGFFKKNGDRADWQCEDLSPTTLRATRHLSRELSAHFLSIEATPLSRHYRLDPAIVFGNPDKITDRQRTAREMVQLKMFGMTFVLDITLPGTITAQGAQRPTQSGHTIRLDMMNPDVWQTDYRIEASESRIGLLAGLGAIAALLIGAGIRLKRRPSCRMGLRQGALPTSLLLATAVLSAPWWIDLDTPAAPPQVAAASPPTPPAAIPQTIAPAPVGPPIVATDTAPPLADDPLETAPPVATKWERFIGQHPYEAIDDPMLSGLLQPVLKLQYSAFKNALSTSSGFTRWGTFVVVSGNAAHQGGMNEAALAIDTINDTIYGAWHEGDQIMIFGANRAEDLPEWLLTWYYEHGGPRPQ